MTNHGKPTRWGYQRAQKNHQLPGVSVYNHEWTEWMPPSIPLAYEIRQGLGRLTVVEILSFHHGFPNRLGYFAWECPFPIVTTHNQQPTSMWCHVCLTSMSRKSTHVTHMHWCFTKLLRNLFGPLTTGFTRLEPTAARNLWRPMVLQWYDAHISTNKPALLTTNQATGEAHSHRG